MLERVHPARPGWYEKLYATAMDKGMQSYEAEVYNVFLILVPLLYHIHVCHVSTNFQEIKLITAHRIAFLSAIES